MFEEMIRPVRERQFPDEETISKHFQHRNLHNFLPSITIPAVSSIHSRTFETAVAVDLARIACAVERYRIKHNDYPDSLDQLTPDFLANIPQDLMAPGKPLNYKKRVEDDRYRIYSVGSNGTDEGGRVVFKSKGRPRRESSEGDWAWGYDFRLPDNE